MIVGAGVPRISSSAQHARLADIAATALTGLEPLVVVNRRMDTAIAQVNGEADRPFPTIHTDGRRDLRTSINRLTRAVTERVRGTHGTGADAGHTVYGSVRFVTADDARSGAMSVVDALQRQGDVGVRAYGPVSFIANPEAIGDRTTFASDDTGFTTAPVRPRSELPTVVAERLLRSDGVASAPDVTRLLQLTDAAASDAVRGWLLSSDLGRSDGYIEAQVRRLAPHDVLATAVDERDTSQVTRLFGIDPGDAVPTRHDMDALDRELARLQVPVAHIGAPPH